MCQVFPDSTSNKMQDEDLLGPCSKKHRKERTIVATFRRRVLLTFFIHLNYCGRAPVQYSFTMQPSMSSMSLIGRSSPAVETTAAGLDKASENWESTFRIQKEGRLYAR